MSKWLTYNDIALVPRFGVLEHRSHGNTSISIGRKVFQLPVIPANMKCVIDTPIAKWMSFNNYFYVMHRFDINIDEFVRTANSESWPVISISIGASIVDIQTIKSLINDNQRIDYITIDIAHGDSIMMVTALKELRKIAPDVTIIAGNVATTTGAKILFMNGADYVKVGIGQGAACTTKLKTGFTTPMFSTIKEIVNSIDYMYSDKIIADGGIQTNGDIAKALVAGASWVMAGGLFAQCTDSPAENINGTKVYFGSASAENKGHSNHVEGKVNLMSNNGMTYEDKLIEIKQDLQSAISYAGGKNLSAFKRVEYAVVN
jgi:GMP reductase